MTTSTVNSTAPASTPSKVVPSEVGWQFVPQYYTFLNKQPQRLHCFYTKNSTFIHGTEGEDGKPCYGQQEIHNKILSIGFQDCKVFIHSVDAQSSANNGIIIQVIGEMSNQGEPWRKFAQTFFLAEQPNGYFVLNDIFRYLKEETYGEEEGSEGGEPSVDSNPATADAVDQPASGPTVPEPVSSGPSEPLPAPEDAPPVQINGYHPEHEQSVDSVTVDVAPSQDEPATVEEPPRSPTPAPEPAVAAEPSPIPSPIPPPAPELPAESPTPAPATVSTPTPAPAPARVSTPTPAPAAPQPSTPAAPKTWANLAAANSNKWGPQVAQEAKGVSAAPAPAPAPVASAPSSSAVDGPRSTSQSGKQDRHPAAAAAMAVTTAQCFVKSVTEVVGQQALRDTLTQRFGPVKELEIVRNKACAFLEFNTVEAARRAILASLPIQQGGEGGIRIDGEGGQYQRISVEIRKERGDRPVSRPRGGGPNGGEPRGTFRGGRGRGGRGGPPTGTDAGTGRGTAR